MGDTARRLVQDSPNQEKSKRRRRNKPIRKYFIIWTLKELYTHVMDALLTWKGLSPTLERRDAFNPGECFIDQKRGSAHSAPFDRDPGRFDGAHRWMVRPLRQAEQGGLA